MAESAKSAVLTFDKSCTTLQLLLARALTKQQGVLIAQFSPLGTTHKYNLTASYRKSYDKTVE